MAFTGGPAGAINSDPIQSKVGKSETNIFTATSTVVTQGTDGKVNGGTTTLFFSNKPDNYIPAAKSTDGGKTWTYLNGSDGKPVLGADAKNSLERGVLKNNTQAQIQSATTKAGVPKEQIKTLSETAAKAGDSPTGDGTGAAKPFDKEAFAKDTVAEEGTRSDFKQKGTLIYPTDIGATKQDVIKFDMLEYKPKEFNKEEFGFSKREREKRFNTKSIGTVILPIPSGISDTNSCNWNQDTMTAEKIELANVALQGITQGGEAAAGAVADGLDRIRSSGKDVGTAFANAIAGQAAGAPGLLTRTTGNVINPNLELLFQSPALRTFGFTFKMSARSEPEAKTIIAILRFFKQGMSAQRSKSNLFLKTPHTFGIRYMHRGQKGEEHKYIGKIKECALTSFTVNYTPEGQYAIFYDGPMVSYEMQMQFQELEPIFNDDYGKDDYNNIGF